MIEQQPESARPVIDPAAEQQMSDRYGPVVASASADGGRRSRSARWRWTVLFLVALAAAIWSLRYLTWANDDCVHDCEVAQAVGNGLVAVTWPATLVLGIATLLYQPPAKAARGRVIQEGTWKSGARLEGSDTASQGSGTANLLLMSTAYGSIVVMVLVFLFAAILGFVFSGLSP